MQTSIILPQKIKFTPREEYLLEVEIDGLYPGYGVTLGNALRRVLLSSLPGAAITEVKIKGVDHEFSTIPGVKEDMVEIMINFKKIRFRLHGDEPQTATIKISGAKEVLAKEIKTPSQLELVTPDVYIATLTGEKAEFDVEITVEKGLGYVSVEQRKIDKLEIGVIALDAIFTPVTKVNYDVENMRVGDRTDFNKLRLLIETDGSISPKDALSASIKILVDQYSELRELTAKDESAASLEDAHQEADLGARRDEKTKIRDLNISLRTINALEKSGVAFLEDLIGKTVKELKTIRGLGEKGMKEIKKELQKLGYLDEE